nr:hypothetical protein [Tanacetum cinerariifolium]
CVFDLRHVGHRTHDIRVHTFIDIETQLLPLRRGEALGRAAFVLWTATYMEEGFHNQLLDQGPLHVPKGGVEAFSVRPDEVVGGAWEVKRTLG